MGELDVGREREGRSDRARVETRRVDGGKERMREVDNESERDSGIERVRERERGGRKDIRGVTKKSAKHPLAESPPSFCPMTTDLQ